VDLAATRGAEHLPCGAEVAELVEQVAAGRGAQRTEHQATCPHCSALLPELDRLWAPIGEFTREQVTPPPGLVTAVMRQVRRLVAAAWLSLRRDSADIGAGRTAIHLDLVTQYGESIPAIAQAVRHTVTKRIQDLTGLKVTEINITIDDIVFKPPRR
jgi:hypothetical protein